MTQKEFQQRPDIDEIILKITANRNAFSYFYDEISYHNITKNNIPMRNDLKIKNLTIYYKYRCCLGIY